MHKGRCVRSRWTRLESTCPPARETAGPQTKTSIRHGREGRREELGFSPAGRSAPTVTLPLAAGNTARRQNAIANEKVLVDNVASVDGRWLDVIYGKAGDADRVGGVARAVQRSKTEQVRLCVFSADLWQRGEAGAGQLLRR